MNEKLHFQEMVASPQSLGTDVDHANADALLYHLGNNPTVYVDPPVNSFIHDDSLIQ